jgi:hypothetical protein
LEARVLGQDRALELFERGSGLDPELVDQLAPGFLVALKRVSLAPAAVQRQHQLGVQALAERVLTDEGFELTDQPGGLSQGKPRIEPVLDRGQPLLLQPADLRPGEGLVCHIGERWSAPQLEGRIETLDRRPGLAGPRARPVPVSRAPRSGRSRRGQARLAADSRARE